MPSIKDAEDRVKTIAQKGLDLLDSGRSWADVKSEHEKTEADMKAAVQEVQDLKGIESSRKAYGAAAAGDTETVTGPGPDAVNEPSLKATKSLGEQVVESANFKSIQGASGQFNSGGIDTKATFTAAGGGAGLIVPEHQTTPVPILFRRMVVADLLAAGALGADKNTLIYPKESSVTNAAATVAEGGLKPASDLNIVQVTETLKKIATTLKVSDEMLADAVAVMSYINARLTLFVQLAEEDQLLNGAGTGSSLTGLNNRTGLATAIAKGTDSIPDAIYKQITAIRTTSFLEPDGIVFDPADWQTVRLAKDANGQYYGGGPFTGAYGTGGGQAPDMLWGKPVVSTPLQTDGVALVGCFQTCAQVFRKGGITVEMTNSNEDDFKNNLVAIRAEERLLLAVYRASGFGKVTGLNI